jgi:predicted transcriptional regulator
MRILDIIRADPGLYLREIPRRTNLSLSTVRYHLRRLQDEALVEPHRSGHYLRYFPADGITREDRPLVAALRSGPQRAILMELLTHPLTFSELGEATGLVPATLSLHLRHLLRTGLVKRASTNGGMAFRASSAKDVSRVATFLRRGFTERLSAAALEIFEG